MLKVPEKSKQEKKALQIVECLLKIRAEREKLELEYEAKRKPYLDWEDQVKAKAMTFLDENGIQSAKTDLGTLIVKHKVKVTVARPDVFTDYILRTGSVELLQTRAHETACREWAEEHGENPPGIEMSPYRTLEVRKPGP